MTGMQILTKTGNLLQEVADLTVLPVFEGQETQGSVRKLAGSLRTFLTRSVQEEEFKGKVGATLLLRIAGARPGHRLLLVGLGEPKAFVAERLRRAIASALKAAKGVRGKTILVPLQGDAYHHRLGDENAAYTIATGAQLADYTFLKYQPEKQKEEAQRTIEKLLLVTQPASDRGQVKAGIDRATWVVPGVQLARDLVNEPALHATPGRLVAEAEKLAKQHASIGIRVFDQQDLKRMGANALLAISRGSDEPPYLIHLTYKPQDKPRKRIALVGKGLTFDSGGLSIKPPESMKTMKIDMAGAATVLGIFSVLEDLEIASEVHGVIPATENLISGKAIKPGDVVQAMNGKTIEILNTDAEGRVILADAFSYLAKQKLSLDAIVDFATLTGACIVALGETIAGLFVTDRQLKEQILAASREEGENLWELPLPEDYRPLIESQIADIANIGKTQWAGAITAALFLKEFVPPDVPWAHLDIAGPAWDEKGEIPYVPKGGTGFGVRALTRFLQTYS